MNAGLQTEIDLNESEIDLNECEHFLKANLDRVELILLGYVHAAHCMHGLALPASDPISDQFRSALAKRLLM